jgi:predicted glycosyltransferase
MLRLAERSDIQVIFTPRSERQSAEIKSSPWFRPEQMLVLDQPVNGLDLLYHSDLVIGGGGTMNREAAVLGVPVVSIFKGESGAVDEWLEQQGKLTNLSSAEEIDRFVRKRDRTGRIAANSSVKEKIIQTILDLAEGQGAKGKASSSEA